VFFPWRRVVAALLVTGCAGLSVVSATYYSTGYQIGESRVAGPDMTVVVRGNPFALPQPAFNAAVADAMDGWAFGLQVHFLPEGNPNAVYRVIMVFNPPGGVADRAYCARPLTIDAPFGVAPGAERTPLFAIFCRGDAVLASGSGSVSTIGGPASPPFREGVGRFTQALFPAVNPENQPESCINDC
jgi:hypothetical protein